MEKKTDNKTKCFRMVCDRKASIALDFIEDKQIGKFHQEYRTGLLKMKAGYSSPFSKIYIQYEALVQIKNTRSIFYLISQMLQELLY